MKVRVGLIGCGIISANHIAAYQALTDVAEVVAVADLDGERTAAAAAKLGDPRQHAAYREMLAAPDVDAVDICLPHHLHRSVTVAALEAGKHVLCEKPIATSLADADAMIAAAERASRVFMVAENFRFLPHVSRTRELLAEGIVGEVVLLQSVFAAFLDGPYLDTPWRFIADEVGGGALVDSGIHNVDLLLAILGRPVAVTAFTRRVRPFFPAEDTAVVTGEFEGGALADLVVGWSMRHASVPMFTLFGSEGTLTARYDRIEVASERLPGRTASYAIEPVDTFRAEVAHFVECVASGRRPVIGGPEARADLEFVLAAYESARSGRRVRIGV